MNTGETLTVNLGILLAFVLIAISALVVLLTGLGRLLLRRASLTTARWRRTMPATARWRRASPATARWRLARSLAAGAVVLGLVFLVALAVVLLGDTSGFVYGVPISFRILLALPILVLLMAAGALVFTVRFWRGSGAGLAARIHQIVAFTGLAALTWFFYQWNLLGWQF
jgi:hypothetical protein